MASDKPDDSVRLYSILNRPEGEIAKMGKISIIKKFEPDFMSTYNGWAYLNPKMGGLTYFQKLVRADLIERAKESARFLHANAIFDLSFKEGYDVWTCSGTAVRVLKSAKKESSSEESDSSEAFQGGLRR